MYACVGWRVRLPEVLSPLVCPCLRLPEVLSPLVSHCLPTCVPVLDVLRAFLRSRPPLSPIVSPHVCLCWMLCPPSCRPLSSIVSPHMCACVGWCVCLPEILSPLVSHCLRLWRMCACVGMCGRLPEVLSPQCLPLLPLSPHMCACVGWRVCLPKVSLCWMVCPHSQALVPRLVSHCLPTCVPVLDDVPAFPKSCLALSPLASPCFPLSRMVSLLALFCWMVCPPSGGRVSPCLPSCFPLLDGASAFPLVSLLVSLCWMVCPPSPGLISPCLQWSPIISPHVCLCWMVCPPSRGLVFACLPLSPHMCACVVWWVLPEVLSPLVSPHVCPCWMVRSWHPLYLFVSPHGCLCCVSAFPRSCPLLSPIVSPHVCLCWMVCPPSRGLVSYCLPSSLIVSPHVCLCWMARPPSRGLVSHCLPLSLLVSPHVCLCWIGSPRSRGLVSPCVPSCFLLLDGVSALWRSCLPLPPFLFPFLGWCVCLPQVLSPLVTLVAHGLSICMPVLDGASAFPRLRLSPIVSPHVCLCWMVNRLPEAPIFSHCLPACAPVLDGVRAFPRSCLPFWFAFLVCQGNLHKEVVKPC